MEGTEDSLLKKLGPGMSLELEVPRDIGAVAEAV